MQEAEEMFIRNRHIILYCVLQDPCWMLMVATYRTKWINWFSWSI